MAKVAVVRWAIGSENGARSSPWRLWGNKKGDIYIAVRALGDIIKLSIHRDGRCQLGFTSEYAPVALARFGIGFRHWELWRLPPAPPVFRILRIIVPQSDLRRFEENHDDDMRWLPAPAEGSVGVVTVVLAPADAQLVTPTGAELVGVVRTSIRSAWAFYLSHNIDPHLAEVISQERDKLDSLPPNASVLMGTRAILWSSGGHDRQVLELAYEGLPQPKLSLPCRLISRMLR